MEQVTAVRTTPRAVSAAWFIGIGLVIYALLLAGSEWLVYRNGRMNPVYKADVAAGDFDWVILGASHAMPLDFGNFNKEMQRRTGKKILNLAGSGTGPLYARFAFEHFLTRHRTRNLLYVADGFAFRAPVWNEGRFTDADLMAQVQEAHHEDEIEPGLDEKQDQVFSSHERSADSRRPHLIR